MLAHGLKVQEVVDAKVHAELPHNALLFSALPCFAITYAVIPPNQVMQDQYPTPVK